MALRYVYFDADVKLDDTPFPKLDQRQVIDASEHYFEPLSLGGRLDLAFMEKWSVRGRFLLGGWGLGDADLGTDGMAGLLLTYRFRPSWTAQVGVRWYDMDLTGNALDVELRKIWGPIAGLIWSL